METTAMIRYAMDYYQQGKFKYDDNKYVNFWGIVKYV